MQASNFYFVFSLLISVAVIQAETDTGEKTKVNSEVKSEVQPVSIVGISGVCSNPESYKGQSLCYPAGQYCGQCVSFVKVCTRDYRTTSSWVRGKQVKNASIAKGTAIATFPNGKYSGHAAIYISQNGDGIQVWDQWVGHPVSTRTIRWNGSGISNNGNSFYVIN